MDNETLIKIGLAVFTFVLGLISKLLYDLWQQRKTKKTLLLTKGIASSFLREDLEENIRPDTKVSYKGHPIDSICIARVEVENSCSSPLRNQTCTVTFSEGCRRGVSKGSDQANWLICSSIMGRCSWFLRLEAPFGYRKNACNWVGS